MRFHKGSFPIQNISGAPEPVQVVTGWIDETNTYGFYKRGKNWVATDLVSGTYVARDLTRKACAEWIEANDDRIAVVKDTFTYYEKVMKFRTLIEETLNEKV